MTRLEKTAAFTLALTAAMVFAASAAFTAGSGSKGDRMTKNTATYEVVYVDVHGSPIEAK